MTDDTQLDPLEAEALSLAALPPPTEAELEEMVAGDSTHVLVARAADGTVVGSMSLVVFRIPTGIRAWIEDVVVDERGRGSGVGAALIGTANSPPYALNWTNVASGGYSITATGASAAPGWMEPLGGRRRGPGSDGAYHAGTTSGTEDS